jgi:hypothetical protein
VTDLWAKSPPIFCTDVTTAHVAWRWGEKASQLRSFSAAWVRKSFAAKPKAEGAVFRTTLISDCHLDYLF